MENTLKETEWLTINKVLLEMYDITDIDQFTERVLKTYRMLIPYTKGYFIVFNEAGGIESEKSSFIEMEPGVYEEYLDSYYEKDYMKYTFELSEHTITYRDTDIMEESLRQKTEFYQGFLKPNHIPFGAGILLRRYGKPIGIVNFFRSELLGDFSDKDMFILEVLRGTFPINWQDYSMEQSRRQATVIRCLRILQQNLNCRSVKKKRCSVWTGACQTPRLRKIWGSVFLR